MCKHSSNLCVSQVRVKSNVHGEQLLNIDVCFSQRRSSTVFISYAKRNASTPTLPVETSDSCTTTIKWRRKTHNNQNYRHYQSYRVWELHSLAMKWRNKMRFVSPQVLQCKFTTCRLWAPAHTLHMHMASMHWRNKHSHSHIKSCRRCLLPVAMICIYWIQNAANKRGINFSKTNINLCWNAEVELLQMTNS